ncbi:MAG: GNAT family N-acetyltransferase [Acidobacteria bacterium]|nr:GNAT family N-acetyltransferase [Acidobacteriota bacterium]
MAIEQECFEPARRETEEHLIAVLAEEGALGSVAVEEQQVAGFCLGGPLELFCEMEWVRQDAELGRRTTLYADDLIVSPARQGHGIGAALKAHQIERARASGYKFISGRYRVGLAEVMGRISRKLGASEIRYLRNSYQDDIEPRDAVYYRMNL